MALRSALLLACALSPLCAVSQHNVDNRQAGLLKAEAHSLQNGVRAIVLSDHSTPLVAVEVWLKCGSADEQPGEEGAAHMLEHMLFKGTSSRGPGQADLEIENLGSTLSATTSRDWMRINTVVASQFAQDAVKVLANIVSAPSLPASELETEKGVVLDEIAQSAGDPIARLRNHIAARAYGDHPYGRPITGTATAVRRLTRETLARFANRALAPSNIAVVIVGDISTDTALSLVSKHFSTLRAKAKSTPTPPQAEPWKSRRSPDPERVVLGGDLAWYAVAFPAPPISNQDEVLVMDVIHSLLDQGPGGRLPRALVATEIAKRLEVEFFTRRQQAMLFIAVGAEPHRLSEARDRLWDELEALRSLPVSPEELAAARRRLLTDYAFATETVSGKAFTIGFYEALGHYQLALNYPDLVSRVGPSDIMSAAKRYLSAEHAVAVMSDAGGHQ
ncbi:MAG: M16 family metallopeptidase [Armatimonadota bacterium]